jgi:hypothetical protein
MRVSDQVRRSCQASPRCCDDRVADTRPPAPSDPGRSGRSCRAAPGWRDRRFPRRPAAPGGRRSSSRARHRRNAPVALPVRAASTLPPSRRQRRQVEFRSPPDHALRRFMTRRVPVLQEPPVGRPYRPCRRRLRSPPRVGGITVPPSIVTLQRDRDRMGLADIGHVQLKHRVAGLKPGFRGVETARGPRRRGAASLRAARRVERLAVSAVDGLHEILPHVGDHAAHRRWSRPG